MLFRQGKKRNAVLRKRILHQKSNISLTTYSLLFELKRYAKKIMFFDFLFHILKDIWS